jgi:hypothetical protein
VARLNEAARQQVVETANGIKRAIHDAYSVPELVEFLDAGDALPTVATYVLDPEDYGDVGGSSDVGDTLDYACGKIYGLMYGAGFETPHDLLVAAGFEDGGVVKAGDPDLYDGDLYDCSLKACAVCHPRDPGAPRYTLDGEDVDLAEFLAQNAESLSPSELHLCRNMLPGKDLELGGGAAATFVLRRVQ